MSNLYFSGEYKDKIIKLLINNNIVVQLINPVTDNPNIDLDLPDVLLGGSWIIDGKQVTEQGNIFNHAFVPMLTDETKTFIFVETDIQTIEDNIFTQFGLYIYVFTHKDLVRLTSTSVPTKNTMKKAGYSGNRIDCLCDAIDRVLNGNESFGIGNVIPASRNHMVAYAPNNVHYGKVLKYTVKNYNPGGEECEV